MKSLGESLSKLFSSKSKEKNDKKWQPANPRNPQAVRLVLLGTGATFLAVTPGCNHVGFHGITSSIGVYLAIDEYRCFIAHIDCRISGGGSKMPSVAACTRLRQEISRRLDAEAAAARGWPAKTDAVGMARLRSSLRMVSKNFDFAKQNQSHDVYPDNVIAQAVNEWLGTPTGQYRDPVSAGGIVVEHQQPYVPQYLVHGTNENMWRFVEQPANDRWFLVV